MMRVTTLQSRGINTLRVRAESPVTSAQAPTRNGQPSSAVTLTSTINWRDLAEASPSSIRPGRIYRCACFRDGLLDTAATEHGVTQVIDLRSAREIGDEHDTVYSGFSLSQFDASGPFASAGPQSAVRHEAPLLQSQRFYRALVSEASFRTRIRAITLKTLNRQGSLTKLGIEQMNKGGLPALYRCILDTAGPEVAFALRAVAQGAPGDGATAFFCRLGKDRTGLLAALILATCGAKDDEIVSDYARSDGALGVALGDFANAGYEGIDFKTFSAAPPEAMEAALAHISKRHGGVASYLSSAGFDSAWQTALRRRLCH